MRRLGISIYPEHSTVEKDKEYLTLASKYGFTRVFTTLLNPLSLKKKQFLSFLTPTSLYIYTLHLFFIVV